MNTQPNPTLRSFLHKTYVPSRLTLNERSVWQLDLTCRLFDKWAGHAVRVRELNERFVTRYLKAVTPTYAPATVNSKRRMILTLWRAAADHDLVAEPRMRKVPTVREPRKNPEAWYAEEVEKIIARCQALQGKVGKMRRCWWWTAWVLVIYETGLRAGTMLDLTPAHYDPEEGYIVAPPSAMKNDVGQLFWLSADTVAVLSHVYDPGLEHLFLWPYSRRHLWRFFRTQVLKKSGLKSARMPEGSMDCFHRLRRTSLSYLARHDISLAVKQAGHCRPEVTRRHYLDERIVRPKDGEKPVDHLPKLSLKPRLGIVGEE